jgi:hypothetical protein
MAVGTGIAVAFVLVYGLSLFGVGWCASRSWIPPHIA